MNNRQLLTKLVSINSIYPNESRVGEYLEQYLKDRRFSVERQPLGNNRFNLLASRGSGNKVFMFYGHLDTVPIVQCEAWQSNPFVLTRRGNNYYGLGTYDMKGGIVAFLDAITRTPCPTKILLAADEENISEGAWAAVRQKKEFFNKVELIVSTEPNFGMGLHSLITGRTGRCVFQVQFQGQPKHIVHYREAVDAIELLGHFTATLYASRQRLFRSPETIVQVRKVEGESNGMSVCGQASVEIEVLLGASDSIQSVQERLQRLTQSKVILKPRATPYLQSYHFDTFPYQEEMGRITQKYTGKTVQLHTRSSVGDDNVLATLGIPVITWGPDGDNAHAPNEYVNLPSINTLALMLSELMKLHG